MADPSPSTLVTGESTTATTTATFTAQPAGTLLVLCVVADDYKTGNPSGWSVAYNSPGSGEFHGHYMWYKIATGSETSVAYTIGSASRSIHVVLAVTNITGTTPLDVAGGQSVNASAQSYTTPSVTTTTGRRIGIAMIGGSNSGSLPSGADTWLNTYTEVADKQSTANPGLELGLATLVFDGGAATSSGATYTSLWTAQSRSGIIAAFKGATTGGTDGAVTSVKATGSASAPNPVVAGIRNATIAAVVATASCLAPAPAVSAGQNGTVAAVKATASSSAVAPVVLGVRNATTTGVAATASATVGVPTVGGESVVTGGGAATGSALVKAPIVVGGALVTGVKATATGSTPAPVVTGASASGVNAVAATGSASSPAPVVTAVRNATTTAVKATGTASAPAPVVTGAGAGQVLAVTATSSAQTLAPTVTVSVTVAAVKGSASATALPPTYTTGANVQAVAATGTALVRAPLMGGIVDLKVTGITDRSRRSTITAHPRQVTITDRS